MNNETTYNPANGMIDGGVLDHVYSANEIFKLELSWYEINQVIEILDYAYNQSTALDITTTIIGNDVKQKLLKKIGRV